MQHAREAAATQAAFRYVNERASRENLLLALEGTRFPFVCECADERCFELVTLSRREYEAVRSDATRFLVAVGHEWREFETVVEENDRFAVVEKHPGSAADVAT